jgi:hypothetical protein
MTRITLDFRFLGKRELLLSNIDFWHLNLLIPTQLEHQGYREPLLHLCEIENYAEAMKIGIVRIKLPNIVIGLKRKDAKRWDD